MPDRSIYTQAVHAGERGPRPDFAPVSTPVHHSVGYTYDTMEELDDIFAGERVGFVYPRYGSPTVGAFERAVTTLEGAGDAVAFASGMAAVHAALLGAGALAHAGGGIWLALTGLGALTFVGLLGLLTVTSIIALPFAGRRLADEAERLQDGGATPGRRLASG